MSTRRQLRMTGLPLLIEDDAEVLILGSFPSEISLIAGEAGEYYANPRNQFWTIMQALFGIDPMLPYQERTGSLMQKHIALWDSVASCLREGSADRRIVDPVFNDIAGLLSTHPSIRLIACNGGASARLLPRTGLPATVRVVRLPSTSPANARLSLPEKIKAWSVIRGYCEG